MNETFALGKNHQEIFYSSLKFVDIEFYYIFHFLLIIFYHLKNFGQDSPKGLFSLHVGWKLFRMFYYIVFISLCSPLPNILNIGVS